METIFLPYSDNEANRNTLFDFYKSVYPNSPWLLDDDRFVWQNLSNPLQKFDECAVWLLYNENGNIIGQNIYIYYNLSVDSRLYRGFCSTNLIVKPGIVGKGFGHKMIAQNESFDGIAYAVGITPASTRAFQKRGWQYITDGKMMSRIIKPFPNLKYLQMPLWKIVLATPVIKLFNFFSNIISLFSRPIPIGNLEIESLESFNPAWDKIWEECLKEYAINFQRVAATLNYKYFSRKDIKHNVLLFKIDGKPVGYVVYRLSLNTERGIKLGRVVDLVYDPSQGTELLNYMIGTVKKEFLREEIDGIVAVAATDEIARVYRKNGLYLSRMQPAIIKEKDFSIEELRKKYKYLWYITLADSDLDNYW